MEVQLKNLTFSEALEHLKAGNYIRVPEWRGYWYLEGGKILVRTWDGKTLDSPSLKETVLREDWQVVQKELTTKELKEVMGI